jgi:hypothetical protein
MFSHQNIKIYVLLFLTCIINLKSLNANASEEFDACKEPDINVEKGKSLLFATKIAALLKQDNRAAISTLINYPLDFYFTKQEKRHHLVIHTPAEFYKYYDQMFSKKNKKLITQAATQSHFNLFCHLTLQAATFRVINKINSAFVKIIIYIYFMRTRLHVNSYQLLYKIRTNYSFHTF